MLAEGYRWHGVAGFQFWFGPERADLHYNSFQPVCVLCREWNWTFAAGEKVKRTLKVFNDTRYDDPIEMTWTFDHGGQVRLIRASRPFPQAGRGRGDGHRVPGRRRSRGGRRPS